MKTIDSKTYRPMAIAALVAIGIASTLATGGGGDGGSIGPQPPPPPTLIDITVDNAFDVTVTVIEAIDLTFDVGDLTGGEVSPGVSAVPPPLVSPDKSLGGIAVKPFADDAEEIQACPNGGTVDITANLASPLTFTVGDTIRAVFDNCDDGDGFILNGQFDLEVTRAEGDFLTEFFLLGLDIVLTDIEIIEDMETSTVDGEFSLTLDALDWPTVAQTIEGGELVFGVGPDTITLTGFTHFIEVDGGMTPEAVLVTVDGRVDSSVLGGAVDYETPVAIQLSGDADPYTGEILVTGNGGSTVRMIFNDPTSITLEVDENGDGVIDEYIETNWAELQGVTSTINSSTAPLVAREAVNVVTGFGSVTITAGAQFQAAGPFGQVLVQGVSGTFDPIELACPAGGTALVSGTIASAGSFADGDFLSVSFTNCARNAEVLDGPLDFTVSGFDQAAGDAYYVTGTASEPCMTRTAGGLAYTGCGDFETNYDGRFTTPSFVYFSATSPDFTVAWDELDRYLSNASVSGEIVVGPPPVTITRTSSGSFGAPGLGGQYAYESVVPDTFLFDDSAATGPYSGELRVTAGDSSSVTIVALDELNVRLDIDYDGDSITDTSITTTWAALY